MIAVGRRRQDRLEAFCHIRGDRCIEKPKVAEVSHLSRVDLVGPQVGILRQGLRIHQAFLIELMKPFQAGAVARLLRGKPHLLVFIDVIVICVFRHAKAGELIPDRFRPVKGEGCGKRI